MQILNDGKTLVSKTYSQDTRLLHLTVSGHFQFGEGAHAVIVKSEQDVEGFGEDVQRMVKEWLAQGGYEKALQEQREDAVTRDAQTKGGLLEAMAKAAGGNQLVAQIHDLLKTTMEQKGASLDDAKLAGYDPDEHPHEPNTILPALTDQESEFSQEMGAFIDHKLTEPAIDVGVVSEALPPPPSAETSADEIVSHMQAMQAQIHALTQENMKLKAGKAKPRNRTASRKRIAKTKAPLNRADKQRA